MAAVRRGARLETPSIMEKLRFLGDPSTYGLASGTVELVETHMSYVFLAGDRAYKLKKPVRYPFLDFSTLEARERDCREEVRLNRRLSEDVYIGVLPLCVEEGRLALGGAGEIVDWLVEMRRLPRDLMLDRLIKSRTLSETKIEFICDRLAQFYSRAARSLVTPLEYHAHFLSEQKLNRDVLTRPGAGLNESLAYFVLDRVEARFSAAKELLGARVADGHVVDGHGDLRPEHICLTQPIAIFDCLEFSAALRQVDPFDEIALLGVECAQLGAPRLLRRFTQGLAKRLDCAPPWELTAFYAAWRATLRARLSMAHLSEPSPREPAKWAPLANRYLDIAAHALADDLQFGGKLAVSGS
jgi:uncharacterized protein